MSEDGSYLGELATAVHVIEYVCVCGCVCHV